MHVHLDHAGVRRDGERAQARIVRRRVALEPDGLPERSGDMLDRGGEVDPVLDVGHRRQEEVQTSAAGLDAERRANHLARTRHRLRSRVLLLLGAEVGVVEVVRRIEGIARELRLDLLGQPLRQGGERQAVTGRRVAGEEAKALAPQGPGRALPFGAPGGRRHRSAGRAELGRAGAERQDINRG
jgi:hypothetical protein